MKKLLVLLLFAAPAWGATYTVTTTAAQETVITRARLADNAIACRSLGLADACTQAQADAAKAGAVTIYSANGPYLLAVVTKAIVEKKYGQDRDDDAAFEAKRAAATAAQKDALCSAIGLAAGCLP